MNDTDALFEALAARRRRYVLYSLFEADGDVSLRDLTGLIAAAEAGRPVVSVPTERRRRIAIELVRTHLPMLEANGCIDYDRESGFVELVGDFERVTPYLELASQYENPPTAAGGEV